MSSSPVRNAIATTSVSASFKPTMRSGVSRFPVDFNRHNAAALDCGVLPLPTSCRNASNGNLSRPSNSKRAAVSRYHALLCDKVSTSWVGEYCAMPTRFLS